jgi:hypothetical protein
VTLFARSFLLIALLILVSAAATVQLYRVYEREPRARVPCGERGGEAGGAAAHDGDAELAQLRT